MLSSLMMSNINYAIVFFVEESVRVTSCYFCRGSVSHNCFCFQERWLRHRDISKQVHTDALMIATQVNDHRKGEIVKRLSQAIQCNWLMKIKRRMQVQYQVEQKNNSMLDNNNDRNAKPEWGTERKEKGSIDRFAFITERTCKGLQRDQTFFEEPLILVSLKKSKKDFTVESETK